MSNSRSGYEKSFLSTTFFSDPAQNLRVMPIRLSSRLNVESAVGMRGKSFRQNDFLFGVPLKKVRVTPVRILVGSISSRRSGYERRTFVSRGIRQYEFLEVSMST